VGQDITIEDDKVHVVPSVATGPLGHGLSALLVGRFSASSQGIFVLPGVIDADFMGPIGIMLKVFTPPLTIKRGSKFAQLIPFIAQVLAIKLTLTIGEVTPLAQVDPPWWHLYNLSPQNSP